MEKIPLGRYQHYKGQFYEVMGLAHHSETMEELVVYKALYATEFGEESLWVRPYAMFTETIVVDGEEQRRFKPVENFPNK